jgi:hypothetical protein
MATEGDELEKLAKQAAAVADKLPDKYQQKGFEVILATLLGGNPIAPAVVTPPKGLEVPPQLDAGAFTIPIDVRAFLQSFSVPEENLSKLFLMSGAEIRHKYRIKTTVKSKAQIQVALLTALENALRGGKFEFAWEDVKSRCADLGVLDTGNYRNHFNNNKKFFKTLQDHEHIEVSPDGKAELAEAIVELSA